MAVVAGDMQVFGVGAKAVGAATSAFLISFVFCIFRSFIKDAFDVTLKFSGENLGCQCQLKGGRLYR